jgi:hypothetical protein
VRVRATANAYLDLAQYEAWTPLKEGTTPDTPEIDRDASGRIRYAWRRGTPPLDQKQQDELVKAGKMKPDEAWIQLQDADTGKTVMAHAGSVYWNAYRQRWITIRCEFFGTSALGEIWYAEADTPLGPWVYARKIVTHDQYTFYNPKQHPYFDQDGGRVIYFEGTYANTFSGNPDKTPRYDYNQIMYRLQLDDPRLALPVPVYHEAPASEGGRLATRTQLTTPRAPRRIAFFALDRPTRRAVAVRRRTDAGGGNPRLMVSRGDVGGDDRSIAFYALPADVEAPPATTVPLYEFVAEDGRQRVYATGPKRPPAGYRRNDTPVCRVWRNPMSMDWLVP